MTADLLAHNVVAHWLQAGLVAGVAWLGIAVLRLRRPDFLLRFWTAVLLLLLATPWIQPWQPVAAAPTGGLGPISMDQTVDGGDGVSLAGRVIALPAARWRIDPWTWALGLPAAGVIVLVDRAPQILSATLDRDEHLVEMPGVSHPTAAAPQPPRVDRTEPLAPLPNRLIGDRHASLREEILDIAEAEAEPMVEPDRVADDLGRESISVIAGRLAPYRLTLPLVASTWQYLTEGCRKSALNLSCQRINGESDVE